MSLIAALAVAAVIPSAVAQNSETILGVYMFHRHGDRTAKAWPPANLTDLGYNQVYDSGSYYNSRYVADGSSLKVNGISGNVVNNAQISASAPVDVVLENSAQGFLQGLYPAVGNPLDTQTLHNGSTVTAPLNGYQLIPVGTVSGGASQENSVWLQAASGCNNAVISSNNYFLSAEYQNLYNSTLAFYQSILPVINNTYNSSYDTYKNAYAVWDLINVASIDNASYPNQDLITPDVFHQLYTLANAHEFGLAYNSSDTIRAVAGMTLAGQIVQFLNTAIAGHGKQKFGVQFGAYGTFMSFFGLAQLPAVNVNFTGITNYASSMQFEMFTNTSTPVSPSSYPSTSDIYVRFLYHNGTASSSDPPVTYPLFGSGQDALSWDDFVNGMNAFAIYNTSEFCQKCGSSSPGCSNAMTNAAGNTSLDSDSGKSSGNGLSPAVNGVIGAMVTLGVILGAEALILLVGGLRIVRKNRLAGAGANGAANNGVKA